MRSTCVLLYAFYYNYKQDVLAGTGTGTYHGYHGYGTESDRTQEQERREQTCTEQTASGTSGMPGTFAKS